MEAVEPPEQRLQLREPALGHVASAFVEAGGAFLIGTAIGFLGFVSGALVCADTNGEGFEELGCALGWGLVAYSVAVPISVWAIGEALRWDGSFWLTLVGTIVGGALFGAVTAGPGLLFGAPIGGAIGFQLSADPYSAPSAFNTQPATFVPVVSFQF